MIDYHDRMPVMFLPEEGEEWLSRSAGKERLMKMMDQSDFSLLSEPVTLESPAKQK
jgi:putative SOS response-associated peptidase YedK